MKSSSINIIKLYVKRGKLTLVLQIDEQYTISQIKQDIVSIVNQTGGLSSLDEDGEDSEDGDFNIPESAFARNFQDSDDSDDSDKEDANGTTNLMKNKIFLSDTDDLKIGVVLDKHLKQTGTNFVSLDNKDDESLVNLKIKDGDVLSFALTNEDFLVIDPSEETADIL